MLRLLQIEWIKARNSRSFKVLTIIWLIAFFILPYGVSLFLDFLESKGIDNLDILNISMSQLPIFDFVDIWQNLAYLYKMITIFLCFIIIVNVSSEFRNKTIRQNVIDGMSKREFILGKMLLIVAFSLLASILLTVIGLITGYSLSPVTDFSSVMENINFVGAYFLHLVYHLTFCLFITILIKRSGLVIALLIFYTYILESIGSIILIDGMKKEWIANLLPLNVSWNIIPRPIEKYGLVDIQDYVGLYDTGIAMLFLIVFASSSYFLITKRDLN